ncbi:MAG: hypothetical protein J0H64_03085, partial [Actinobacteria bacterium]|nr:hypothetical protein [Actinomycetota bacterium]
FELPLPILLPDWNDWIRPLLFIVSLWGGIMLWLGGLIMLSLPGDARRGIAIRRFGDARGLHYARFGFAPERIGIMFAEGRGVAPMPRRVRENLRRSGAAEDDPARKPLYRAEFVLWRGLAYEPELQIARASFSGSKSDTRGPRDSFRYLSIGLPRRLPHLMIDSLRNGRMRSILPGDERISLEGDFDRHFAVYAPKGYERDALELLTPDVMACLIDHGRSWDIEVVEDRLFVVSSRARAGSDRAEIPALLRFAELIGEELGHQAITYTDPRAELPRSEISAPGRRLRRRSQLWATAIAVIALSAWIGFPWLLGLFLD